MPNASFAVVYLPEGYTLLVFSFNKDKHTLLIKQINITQFFLLVTHSRYSLKYVEIKKNGGIHLRFMLFYILFRTAN